MSTVEAGGYMDELFCLKRDASLSNLPPEDGIKTVRKPKTNVELKIAHINLFDVEGNITVLELWNEDAVKGVRYLWNLLGDSDEVLLRIKNLESPNDTKDKKTSAYRTVPPTTFMVENYSFPVKARIVAQTPLLGQPCDLSKQCKHITLPYHVQLLCDGLPVRPYSQWHRTLEDQEEDDQPDELQKLIHRAVEKGLLGKRERESIAPNTNTAQDTPQPRNEHKKERHNDTGGTANANASAGAAATTNTLP